MSSDYPLVMIHVVVTDDRKGWLLMSVACAGNVAQLGIQCSLRASACIWSESLRCRLMSFPETPRDIGPMMITSVATRGWYSHDAKSSTGRPQPDGHKCAKSKQA